VSVPFVWRLHQYPVDNWRISPNGLRVLFKGIKWDAIRIASDRKLMPEDVKKVPSIESRDGTYLLRCETPGFGRKRA
jgi:hypothetical protein